MTLNNNQNSIPENARSLNLMPAMFIGHGNPMFVLNPNRWTESWQEYALSFEKPKAILSISAHWFKKQSMITVSTSSELIYDFYGFPQELYEVKYPVSGSAWLEDRLQELLKNYNVSKTDSWGIDHGTWTVLKHMYPKADIPVTQLSVNYTLDIDQHLKIGNLLKVLRNEGVLILGSGNIVHNLRQASFDLGFDSPYDYTVTFDESVSNILLDRNFSALTEVLSLKEGKLSVPTLDHYLPLLYVVGASEPEDELTTICQGYDAGSLSMRSVSFSR